MHAGIVHSYGDAVPITDWGKFVASLAMVAGLLCIALPVTIITANLSATREEYNALKLERERQLARARALGLRRAQQRAALHAGVVVAAADTLAGTGGDGSQPVEAEQLTGTDASASGVHSPSKANDDDDDGHRDVATAAQARADLERAHAAMVAQIEVVRTALARFDDAALDAEVALVSWSTAARATEAPAGRAGAPTERPSALQVPHQYDSAPQRQAEARPAASAHPATSSPPLATS
jgi:hypothetical protein